MPNVNITVTNPQTGWSRTIPTNDSGQYVVPDIQIGHYNVKAEASGFKISEQPVLATGKVRQVGELVAMCLASTRAEAEDIAASVTLDLEELLATRLLVQGNSGSGKSHLLRRLLEGSAGLVQQIVNEKLDTLEKLLAHLPGHGAPSASGEGGY